MINLAKRFNNNKRQYLFVNKKLAKHIPTDPDDLIGVSNQLAYAIQTIFQGNKLLIGFAETATALGLFTYSGLRKIDDADLYYIQTTREDSFSDVLFFEEEHSHATDQKLKRGYIESVVGKVDTVVFIDDEISTGKTIKNAVDIIKKEFPALSDVLFVGASLISSMTEERERILLKDGIEFCSLEKIPTKDYAEEVAPWSIKEAMYPEHRSEKKYLSLMTVCNCKRPSIGLSANTNMTEEPGLEDLITKMENEHQFVPGRKNLILGTEECMYPAIRMAKLLKERYPTKTFLTHSTTRSPIGIMPRYNGRHDNYPIYNGAKLRSLYDPARITYLYDLDCYDNVIVMSDCEFGECGMQTILDAFSSYENNTNFTYVEVFWKE